MASKQQKKFSWSDVKDITAALRAVDLGILLDWQDARPIVKTMSDEDKNKLVKHMAERMGERYQDRLATEILIESLMIFLTSDSKEDRLIYFIESLVNLDRFEQTARVFVEVCLGSDEEIDEKNAPVKAVMVALICELGLCIHQIEDESPGHLERGHALLEHMTTYLLSVGNTGVPAIRLSLMRYFSKTDYGSLDKHAFNKIMGRFGHSLFELLFQQLFNKKSESVALQFLSDNLPTALEASGDCQIILHETFKQYMLKYPERFSLFMHEMGVRVLALNPSNSTRFCDAASSYYKHLVALYKVTSDLDHRSLGKEVLSEIMRMESYPGCAAFSEELSRSPQLRKVFRDLVLMVRKDTKPGLRETIVSQFRLSKRGRKPTLSKKFDTGFLEQVIFLSDTQLKKSA